MAKARKVSPTPLIRSQVREGVRSGLTPSQISELVNRKFANVNNTGLNAMIRQETKRQNAVDAIMSRDKRKSLDLRALVGCRGKSSQVRARLTITFLEPSTGLQKTYGHTTTLDGSGRLATILNKAIAEATADAVSRGYTPPTITSAQTGGRQFYRIEYIECT